MIVRASEGGRRVLPNDFVASGSGHRPAQSPLHQHSEQYSCLANPLCAYRCTTPTMNHEHTSRYQTTRINNSFEPSLTSEHVSKITSVRIVEFGTRSKSLPSMLIVYMCAQSACIVLRQFQECVHVYADRLNAGSHYVVTFVNCIGWLYSIIYYFIIKNLWFYV